MKVSVLIALTFLVGCTTSTGIIPIGQDTYMISGSGKSPGGYSGSEVKAVAFREATKYCTSIGKKLQVVSTNQRDMSYGVNATAELQFMCLDSTDAELGRPKLKKDADQVIGIRKDVKVKSESTGSRDVYGELIKLDDLRRKGILSEAEFEAQKKAILSGK